MAKSKFYRTKEWETLRKVVLKRDHWRCQICGCGVRGKRAGQSAPVVDHITPRPHEVYNPRTGVIEPADYLTKYDVITNLQLLCLPCSNRKSQHDGSFGEPKAEIGSDGFPVGSEWS